MKLPQFLLILTSIVTFLSAFCILIGSGRKKRLEVLPYFLAILSSSIWSITTFLFVNTSPENSEVVKYIIPFLFLSPLFMDICLVRYIFRRAKTAKTFFTVFSVLFFFLVTAILFMSPSDFYTSCTISSTGNLIDIADYSLYIYYAIYFFITTLIIAFAELYQFLKAKVPDTRFHLFIAGAGVFITRMFMYVFGIVSPMSTFSTYWLAPVLISLMIAFDYYAILKCRVVDLSSKALKFFSNIILIASGAVCYVMIVYIVLKFLFKANNLSDDVYVLNYIMAAVLFFILPILNSLRDSTKSEIEKDDSHQAEILKKLNKMSTNSDADKLASFLASEYNLSYVGIVIGSKVHGPKSEKFTNLEIVQIMSLGKPEHGIWQEITSVAKGNLEKHGIKSVAAMLDARGKVFGQILIGTPTGKDDLDESDIENLESIINLISAMIDSRAK